MVTPDRIQSLDPRAFEELVAALWEEKGYEAATVPASEDRDVDVVAERPDSGERVALQVKRYTEGNLVDTSTVQRCAGLAQTTDADAVALVTSSGFTESARAVAEEAGVGLYDGSDLVAGIAEAGIDPHQFGADDSGTPSR